MAYANVELELAFEDESTKKITIGPFDITALNSVKERIKTFNGYGRRDWKDLVCNESGSPIKTGTDYPSTTPIKNATVIAIQETDVI